MRPTGVPRDLQAGRSRCRWPDLAPTGDREALLVELRRILGKEHCEGIKLGKAPSNACYLVRKLCRIYLRYSRKVWAGETRHNV
jgi:hypothetical protein